MTALYKLSENAKDDLKRIVRYGTIQFGESQADLYYRQLFGCFRKIASAPFVYQAVDEIKPGYRRCTCGSESIFYRVSNDQVEIMAILGHQESEDWL